MKGRWITRGFLVVAAFVTLFPLYWIVITSFKTQLDIAVTPTYLPWVDFMPTLDGWRWLLSEARSDVIRAIVNSLIVSGGSAVIATILGAGRRIRPDPLSIPVEILAQR